MSDTWAFYSSSPGLDHASLTPSPPFYSSPPHPSPHLPHPQVTSPHLPHPQVTSPHLGPPQVTSPHLPHPQLTSPHLLHQYATSPHLLHRAMASPHLLPPPQDLFNQAPGPGLDEADWSRLPCLLGEDGSSYQDQTSVHLDDPLSTQQLYNTHTHFDFSTPGPGQDTWGPLQLIQPQLQGSPLGYQSAGAPLGRWSSMEDFPSTQFLHDAPQPFSSPTTPGLSPHYPQTPTVSVPGPQHRMDRPGPQGLMEPYQDLQQQTGFLPRETELLRDLTDLLSPGRGSEEDFRPPGREARPSQRKEGRGGRRGGGGAEPDVPWVRPGGTRRVPTNENMETSRQFQGKAMEPERSTEAPESRLLCLVCKRDFKSLPALNGHMRSHSGFRSAAWLNKVVPVSTSVQSRGAPRASRRGQRRCGAGSPALYRSLMNRDGEEAEEGEVTDVRHYTPPPMLSPMRAGPGLFCSLATRGRQRAQTIQLHNGLDETLGVKTAGRPTGTPGVTKLRINLGRDFQADIPPLQSRKHADSDSHDALLLWTPWEDIECPVNQQRVEALLMMAQSSVVAGGGASTEETLHVLSESRGDFLVALETLLSTRGASDSNHAGWSAAEKKLLVKSMQLHQKDFRRIQETVRTKTLSECVEFYYLWKKKLNLKTSGGTFTLPNVKGQSSSGPPDAL